MRRIVYLSSSRAALDKEQIEDILRTSRRNNEPAGVTGFLAYHDRCFFQVLEGPVDAVEAVLTRIRRDSRHSSLLVLSDQEVDAPAFPNWQMAFVARADLATILDKSAISLTDIAPQAGSISGDSRVNKLFKSFLGSFRDLNRA